MSKFLNEVCDMLDSYGGRDKVMKALCYSTKLVAGLHTDAVVSKKFAKFSSAISGARATLRLVDDIPMLQYSLDYGLGHNESDKTMSFLGVFANIVDLLYYPVEKVCWLVEHQLLDVKNPDKWDMINSIFWVLSIYLNLMRTLRSFTTLQQHKQCLGQIETNNSRENFAKLLEKQHMEILTIIRLSLDFTHAVSTLPTGYLWGGRLKTWHVGLIGTSSAVLGIYQFLAKKNATK